MKIRNSFRENSRFRTRETKNTSVKIPPKCPWKFRIVREKLEKSVRESHLSIREKLEKRAQIGFTGTFDFHSEKKNTDLL